MQAIILFIVFGLFSSIVGGIVWTGAISTQQVTLSRAEEMKTFGKQFQTVVGAMVDQNMASLSPSLTCGGATYAATSIQPYVCQPRVAQFISWSPTHNQILDPWNNVMEGVVVQTRTAIMGGFYVPETVYVLVSPGSDRRLGASLQASLTTLKGISWPATAAQARQAKGLTNNASEANGADDIIIAFSDLPFIEKRWDKVKTSLDQLAGALQNYYQQQFAAFKPAIDQYNASNSSLVAGNTINLDNASNWRTGITTDTWNGYTRPKLKTTFITNITERGQVGISEAYDMITTQSKLALTPVVSSNGDIMTLTLSNNGSPWGDASGLLSYTYTIDMIKTN